MKSSLTLFFTCCFTALCLGQEGVRQAPLENIQYMEDLKMYGDDIYCAGFTFKTLKDIPDTCDAYLVNYDKQTLKPKWSLKVSDDFSNKISAILRDKDKIYALVTQGTIIASKEEVRLSLFVLNLNGEILEKIPFGPSFATPCNMEIRSNELYFGYEIGTSTTYSNNELRSVIVNYNLETKAIVKLNSNQYQPRPKKIVLYGDDAYLFGIYLHPDQPNFFARKKGQYAQVYLKSTKTEYFLDSYTNDKTLTILCIFPGVYGDMNKYLRYYYVHLVTGKITVTTIPYNTLGWSDIRFDALTEGTSTWLLVQELESKQMKFVLLDNKGKVTKSIKYPEGNGYGEKYIINQDYWLKAGKGTIKLTKLQ